MKTKHDPEGLSPRLLAAAKLQVVLTGEQFSPLGAGEIADGRDRAFANKIVTMALRRQGHLNKIIAQVLDRGVPKRSGNFEAVLRLALTELLFLEDGAAHSALFLAVEAVKRDKQAQHLVKLMNGVLRRVQREAENFSDLPLEDLLPEWLRSRWQGYYGEAAVRGFGENLLAGAPLDLTLRDEDDELIEALNASKIMADSVRITTRDRSVVDLPGYDEGRWWVQDVASAVPARLMGLDKGARVLDMCAAPGGKTAQLLKAGYNVTALDMDEKRLERVAENLERLGYSATLVTGNGKRYRPEEKFDGVLVDAPCTAMGTFRRHPEVLWHRVERDIAQRAGLQWLLIENAVKCLKEGGVLIYSTCSLEPEENEELAQKMNKSMPEMIDFPIEAKELGGLKGVIDDNGWVRLHPAMAAPGEQSGGMDGFFVARFRHK